MWSRAVTKKYSCKEKYRENIVEKVEKRHIELVRRKRGQLPTIIPHPFSKKKKIERTLFYFYPFNFSITLGPIHATGILINHVRFSRVFQFCCECVFTGFDVWIVQVHRAGLKEDLVELFSSSEMTKGKLNERVTDHQVRLEQL